MLADTVRGRRCVIWFGQPKPDERMTLAAEGWQTRAALPQGSDEVGIRSGDTAVGLVDFRDAWTDELQWVARYLSKYPLIPTIAFGLPTRGSVSAAGQAPLESCEKHFPGDDLKPVLAHLHSIDAPAHAPGKALSIESLMGDSPALGPCGRCCINTPT